MIRLAVGGWKGRILIVEDDAELREELSELFECRGFSVAGAGDVGTALKILRETTESFFMLTDFRLPGASGLDLVRSIRADPALDAKVQRVVMMTGHSELTELVDSELARNNVRMLTKPVASDQLMAALGAADPALVPIAGLA